jgi:hypothetical protein
MGLTQVLFSMAVIELAKPGLEATSYELIMTVGNTCLTLNSILSTQILSLFHGGTCPESTPGKSCVATSSYKDFRASDGPDRFTLYSLTLVGISIVACCLFTPFLPKNIEECHEWRKKGEDAGQSVLRGVVTLGISLGVIGYGFSVAFLLLDPSTSCLTIVGGSGC